MKGIDYREDPDGFIYRDIQAATQGEEEEEIEEEEG